MEKAAFSEPGPETRQNASDPHQPDRFEERRISSASHPRTDLENFPERMAATAQGLSTTTSVADTGANPDDYPEGGRQALIVLFGAWCVLFCTFGLGNSIGVFQTYYVTDALREYSSSTISWITSFMQWTLNFMPIVWGFAFDKWGPRWLLICGSITYVFGIMMVSLGSEYFHFFLAQSIVCPIGASAVTSASMSCLVTWFHRRRATAFGIMMSGSSVGGVILPIMIPRMIESVGFPWAMRAVGFMFLSLLAIACFTVRSRLAPQTKPVDMKEYFRGIREPTMMSTVFGLFLVFWGLFVPYAFVILQAKAQGMDDGLVIYLLPIMHAVGLIGRVIPGLVADKIGRYNIMIILATLTGIACLALWIPIKSNAGILVFTAAFGFLSSGLTSIGPTLIAQISDIREIGARTGTAFAFQSFGALTGSPIASAIVDARGGDYLGLQLFCGFSILASAGVFASARYVQAGGFELKKV
ncbi:riboflavin transporter MCH5 [Colletotrichum tamarilloi]|uniref:Riboflavin transporter MCH5 n=1 Tax=Colletotrichum tamarilloi TaxID=1209934 RepID=A0ABQ9R365_9PEZI|nr:riboflavin transporter MCH5 [Colletotrichum tamarilloi]KAK1493243.1 riboflavin transporter MCH5 [Colletotrichum tamarilloi]